LIQINADIPAPTLAKQRMIVNKEWLTTAAKPRRPGKNRVDSDSSKRYSLCCSLFLRLY